MRCRTISVGLTCLILAMLATGAWAAPKYKVLHTFTGGTDGEAPFAPPIFDKAGNLFGTTDTGGGTGCSGGLGCGTVYELVRSGSEWTESVVYAFTGGTDGAYAVSGVIFDAPGHLYGVTYAGGEAGVGTAYELMPGSSGWTESVLHSFTGGSEGQGPTYGGLTFDKHGRLYGMTNAGGLYDSGTLFELIQDKGGWGEKTLLVFGGEDGYEPPGPVVLDATGNVYATATWGGTPGGGTVVEWMRDTKKEKTLYDFKCYNSQCKSKDGWNPEAGVIFDKSGNLYGTTSFGGSGGCPGGCGTVFELSHFSGGKWKETLLYSFKGGSDGARPFSSLVFDKAGNLYGTTYGGYGAQDFGTVFKLKPSSGGRWSEAVLHRFTGGGDGRGPIAGVVLDAEGNVFGTTEFGGQAGCGEFADGCGVVFEITP